MDDNCVLLITGCITPHDGMFALKLTDPEERKKQYLESIEYYITSSPFKKIVYCDNSSAVCPAYIQELARKYSKSMEWISFAGNKENAVKQGKGYGEGEITEYAFQNSLLMQNSDYMVKVTGRLIVKNLKVLYKTTNMNKPYFRPMTTEDGNKWIDTRMYMMPLCIYEEYFRKVYTQVDDRNGLALERIFASVIQENNLRYSKFIIMPDFHGISGTSGVAHDLTLFNIVKKTLGMYLQKKY